MSNFNFDNGIQLEDVDFILLITNLFNRLFERCGYMVNIKDGKCSPSVCIDYQTYNEFGISCNNDDDNEIISKILDYFNENKIIYITFKNKISLKRSDCYLHMYNIKLNTKLYSRNELVKKIYDFSLRILDESKIDSYNAAILERLNKYLESE